MLDYFSSGLHRATGRVQTPSDACLERSRQGPSGATISPVCYLVTLVLSYHPCVILSPVCCLINRVLSHHPCVVSSPVGYLITRVLSYHPCVISSPVCYLITRVLSYHPCDISSPVITRVLSHHLCVILSPVYYTVSHSSSRARPFAGEIHLSADRPASLSQPFWDFQRTTMVVAAAGLGE